MAATKATIRVKGLRELRAAIKAIDADLSRELDDELRREAGVVAQEASRRFQAIDARSASGFKPRLRGFGKVSVVQSVRSKRRRPDFGSLQMRRALIPAVWSKADELERELDRLIGRLADRRGF